MSGTIEAQTALVAGAIAVAIAEVGVQGGIAQNLLQVGAPAVVGSCAADVVLGGDSVSGYDNGLKRAIIAGGVGVGVLVASGAYQFTPDLGSLSFVLLIGGSASLAAWYLQA